MGRHSQKLLYALNRATTQTTENEDTAKQYEKHNSKFCDFCKEQGITNTKHIKGKETQTVQAYADYLQESGKAAATIHTYIAGPCKALGVKMSEIEKPLRTTLDITRSRENFRNEQGTNEENDPRFQRLIKFAGMVGIRREEYAELKITNIKKDEAGYFCIEVEHGKGGKYQLQRILPDNIKDVKAIIKESKGNYIFTKEEMNNKIDLHSYRARNAQEAYRYYDEKIRNEKGYKEKLYIELVNRWNQLHKYDPAAFKKYLHELKTEHYITRGHTREISEANHGRACWNRLAVMAVSVFHLSHWRSNVTINNYLIN